MKETRHSQGKFNIVMQHFLRSLLVKFEVTTTKSFVAFGGSAHHCFRMAPETAAASKKRKQTEKADESPQKKTKHDKASADKKKKKSAVDKKKTHTKSDKSSEQKVTTKAKKTLDVPTPDKASLSPIKTSQVSSLSLTLSFTIEILLLLSNIVCSSLPLM